MQFLAKLSVKRPVLATVLILLICVIGLAGYTQLGVDRFPKVDFPTVAIITRMPGAAPGSRVVTTTVGKSTFGKRSSPSLVKANAPTTVIESVMTVAKTGRRTEIEASHCMT